MNYISLVDINFKVGTDDIGMKSLVTGGGLR